MQRPFSFFIFIILSTTTTLVCAKNSTNSYPKQIDQSQQMRTTDFSCITDNDCGNHGYCRNNICQCNDGYITWKESGICAYNQVAKLTAFLVSFFVGTLGVDWFVLARGNGGYIAGGVVKLLMSCGCCVGLPCVLMGAIKDSGICTVIGHIINGLLVFGSSIWWLVDWIRILASGFPDGNGAPLKQW